VLNVIPKCDFTHWVYAFVWKLAIVVDAAPKIDIVTGDDDTFLPRDEDESFCCEDDGAELEQPSSTTPTSTTNIGVKKARRFVLLSRTINLLV
jgi:hypothetical protein